jgi:hypothetical protein
MLCVGVVISIALALACAIKHNPARSGWNFEDLDEDASITRWFSPPPDFVSEGPNRRAWSKSLGYSEEYVSFKPYDIHGTPRAGPTMYGQSRTLAGLPFPALVAGTTNRTASTARFQTGRFAFCSLESGGIWYKGPPTAPMSLANTVPLMPFWPGLLADGLLYAILVGSLVLGLAAARRWLRLRRGQCLRCGYTLAGLPKCPECGTEHRSAAA